MRKLWIKSTNPISYKIVIDDNVITGVDRGVYVAQRTYEGEGDHAGLFVLEFEGVFVITDKIGDGVNLSTNFPPITGGVYNVDDTKKPTATSTVYKNTSGKYVVANEFDGFSIYGDYLMPEDKMHDDLRYDRDGGIKTASRVYVINPSIPFPVIEWDDVFAVPAHSDVSFLVTQDEIDSGIYQNDIKADADNAFLANNYEYSFAPANNWSGWYSNTLLGEYSAFGDGSGTQIFGYFEYLDDQLNSYTKGFEITEADGVWSVVYQENNQTYTSNTEPINEDIVFTNSELTPNSITLTFNDYITRNKSILTTMIADDLV